MASKRRNAQTEAVIERFGLSDVRQKYPRSLSMGERQKALLARAVVAEPFVLLVDEPAAHLDSNASAELVRLLERENLRGMTIVIATSDANFAAQFSSPTIVHL